MMKLIKEYLKFKLECKKSLRKEIKRIDAVVKTLAIAQVEQNMLIEEFKKESYKTKFQEEHKKFKAYEKEMKQKMKELQEALKGSTNE